MNFRIEGLEELQAAFTRGAEALKSLEGEIRVTFDPDDESSVEAEIRRVWALIDQRVGRDASNKLVAPIVKEMKERYAAHIREQAREAREHPSQ
jgi:hypothetical protein